MTENQQRAHEELMTYQDAQREIEETKLGLERIETQCNRMTRSCDSIMKDTGIKDSRGNMIRVPIVVQGGSVGNAAETLIDALMDHRSEYMRRQSEAERLCMKLELLIYKRCSGAYATILAQYYLQHCRLEQIAVSVGYCYRQTKRKRWDALEMYGEKMSPNVPLM